MNATLRDNIIFGSEEDEDKLQAIIKACCLERDLEMLPNGEFTEIGEKGINLSGKYTESSQWIVEGETFADDVNWYRWSKGICLIRRFRREVELCLLVSIVC